MVGYFLKSEKKDDENWEYYKVGLLEDILETAKSKFDKLEYENATFLQENYKKDLLKKRAEKYPDIPFFDYKDSQNSLDENQLEDRFNFYVSISDTLNIFIYGNDYATFLTKSYEKIRKEYIESQMLNFDYVSNLVIDASDSIRVLEKQQYLKNRPILLKNEIKKYDEITTNQLNSIAWNFYLFTKSKKELKKALKWSSFSLNLNSTPEKIDTYAHLLYSLGQTKEAIRYQTKAIKEANKEEKYSTMIEELRTELQRFQRK